MQDAIKLYMNNCKQLGIPLETAAMRMGKDLHFLSIGFRDDTISDMGMVCFYSLFEKN